MVPLDELGERGDVRLVDGKVETPLVEDRGGSLAAHVGSSTGRASVVSGPHLDMVGQREQPLFDRAVLARDPLLFVHDVERLVLEQQVEAPDVTHEQAVPG